MTNTICNPDEKKVVKEVIMALTEAGVDDDMIGFREGSFVDGLFCSYNNYFACTRAYVRTFHVHLHTLCIFPICLQLLNIAGSLGRIRPRAVLVSFSCFAHSETEE